MKFIKFHGSLTSVFRQIGNAVPPLLAFKLAKNISKHIQCVKDIKTLHKKTQNRNVFELRKSAFIYKAKNH